MYVQIFFLSFCVFFLFLLFLYFRIYIMAKNISLNNIQKEKDVLVDVVATQRNLFLRVNISQTD